MKVGVLGGTFDPIHYGHLLAAEEAWAQRGLDYVLFVPAGQPPHKLGLEVSSPAHRAAMVDIAIATNPHFKLSRVDLERPGPSYSVDTVETLQGELGPQVELFFIIGLDSLADMLRWHDPERLMRLVKIVAVSRPGYASFDLSVLEGRFSKARQRIEPLSIPQLDISASELRQRVADGRSIKYQVPEAVEEYIYRHGLYRD